MSQNNSLASLTHLVVMFEVLDADRSGYVDKNELSTMISSSIFSASSILRASTGVVEVQGSSLFLFSFFPFFLFFLFSFFPFSFFLFLFLSHFLSRSSFSSLIIRSFILRQTTHLRMSKLTKLFRKFLICTLLVPQPTRAYYTHAVVQPTYAASKYSWKSYGINFKQTLFSRHVPTTAVITDI